MSAQLALWYGADSRDRIIAALRANHHVYLTTLRSFAREHALRHGEVTIDDVRRIAALRDWPTPSEVGIRAGERIYGAVFAGQEWEPQRQVISSRPERIARSGRGSSYIWVYRLKGSSK